MNIHFSVDDCIKAFVELTEGKNTIKSIFETDTFSMAKLIHEHYGLPVSFYCMWTDGTTSLDKCTANYRSEFIANSDWLKFGFHCDTYETNYNDAFAGEAYNDYQKVISEVNRITGGYSITDKIRLHYFSGNKEVIRALTKDCGVKTLLSADDDRISYGLDASDNEILKSTGFFHDDETNCDFVRTDIRIENIKDVSDELKKIDGRQEATIFTHEKYLSDDVYRERIMLLLKLVSMY